MIPGFVVPFKDKEENIHLYFYPGYDDDFNPIYKDIDWNNSQLKPEINKNIDGSKDYVFKFKNINTISCKLVKNSDNNFILKKFYL